MYTFKIGLPIRHMPDTAFACAYRQAWQATARHHLQEELEIPPSISLVPTSHVLNLLGIGVIHNEGYKNDYLNIHPNPPIGYLFGCPKDRFLYCSQDGLAVSLESSPKLYEEGGSLLGVVGKPLEISSHQRMARGMAIVYREGELCTRGLSGEFMTSPEIHKSLQEIAPYAYLLDEPVPLDEVHHPGLCAFISERSFLPSSILKKEHVLLYHYSRMKERSVYVFRTPMDMASFQASLCENLRQRVQVPAGKPIGSFLLEQEKTLRVLTALGF